MKHGTQAAAPPVVVVVNGLADLLPDSYSGDDTSVDIKECFARYRQWLGIHNNGFVNVAEQVAAIKFFFLVLHYNGLMESSNVHYLYR